MTDVCQVKSEAPHYCDAFTIFHTYFAIPQCYTIILIVNYESSKKSLILCRFLTIFIFRVNTRSSKLMPNMANIFDSYPK